jgi:hypothetical protein
MEKIKEKLKPIFQELKNITLNHPSYMARCTTTAVEDIDKVILAIQELIKEKQGDWQCPHSKEWFNEGESFWIIQPYYLDKYPIHYTTGSTPSGCYAYFHTEKDALKWNKEKFGVKEEAKEETRYWECISDLWALKIGKIYEMEAESINDIMVRDDRCDFNSFNKSNFKPSTKEAYDKQEDYNPASEHIEYLKQKPSSVEERLTKIENNIKYLIAITSPNKTSSHE